MMAVENGMREESAFTCERPGIRKPVVRMIGAVRRGGLSRKRPGEELDYLLHVLFLDRLVERDTNVAFVYVSEINPRALGGAFEPAEFVARPEVYL